MFDCVEKRKIFNHLYLFSIQYKKPTTYEILSSGAGNFHALPINNFPLNCPRFWEGSNLLIWDHWTSKKSVYIQTFEKLASYFAKNRYFVRADSN